MLIRLLNIHIPPLLLLAIKVIAATSICTGSTPHSPRLNRETLKIVKSMIGQRRSIVGCHLILAHDRILVRVRHLLLIQILIVLIKLVLEALRSQAVRIG